WELGSCETECMIGYHSVSVIADVMMKEIGVTRDAMGQPKYPFDYKLALEAMMHSARLKDSAFLDLYGQKLGYMGIENTAESVSKLLEYAYWFRNFTPAVSVGRICMMKKWASCVRV
ncbi:MAG: hypothetical protein EBT66_10380, partial [Bacteroidetes bacterium]|nr:hypothetical protein [Bacteroidota bacterium]